MTKEEFSSMIDKKILLPSLSKTRKASSKDLLKYYDYLYVIYNTKLYWSTKVSHEENPFHIEFWTYLQKENKEKDLFLLYSALSLRSSFERVFKKETFEKVVFKLKTKLRIEKRKEKKDSFLISEEGNETKGIKEYIDKSNIKKDYIIQLKQVMMSKKEEESIDFPCDSSQELILGRRRLFKVKLNSISEIVESLFRLNKDNLPGYLSDLSDRINDNQHCNHDVSYMNMRFFSQTGGR